MTGDINNLLLFPLEGIIEKVNMIANNFYEVR